MKTETQQHAPGPWNEVEGFIVGRFSDGKVYDICDPRCAPAELSDEIDANAALTAPELLKACREGLENLTDAAKLIGWRYPALRTLAAAIAKAEGRAS